MSSKSDPGVAENDEAKDKLKLACLLCRSKKAKCSGDKPRCAQCSRLGLTCLWPDGRRRKRTKREMEMESLTTRYSGGQAIGMGNHGVTAAAIERDVKPVVGGDGVGQRPHTTGGSRAPPLPTIYPDAGLLGSGANPRRASTPVYNPYLALNTRPFFPSAPGLSSAPVKVDVDWDLLLGDPARPTSAYDAKSTGPSSFRPTDAKQQAMLASIANQVGYLEGKDDEPYLKVHYFRISGRTSLHPGINRISLKLRLKGSNSEDTSRGTSDGTAPTPSMAPSALPLSTSDYPTVDDAAPNLTPQLGPGCAFDTDTQMPLPQVYMPLLAIFFDVVAQHFPSVQPKRIYKRIEEGTMSAFLCNAMCAIAARFSAGVKDNAAESGNIFMEKCSELLVPLLRLPTTDGVTGLQLMAWCEYALNSESGFWSYTGLAVRMSDDLGFHKDTEEIFEDSGHYVRNKLLFWSLFVTDRLVSFATGRVCSMKEDVIELPLPVDEDMIPRPTPEGTDTTPRPSPFVALVRLMVICGRMSDVLNGNRGAPRTFMPSPPPLLREKIAAVQDDFEAFYGNLPPALHWSAATYKHFASIGQGGVFLTLHCHANALLTLFARPTILFGSDDAPELSLRRAFKESDRVSLASSRLIAECIVYSDLYSPISYMASPHVTQALYIAGVAFIKEMTAAESSLNTGEAATKPGGSNEAFLYMVANQNLDIIFKALKKLESVWMGAGVSAYVLAQRAKGLGEGQIDLADSSSNIPSFVSVKDAGVLKRFIGRDVQVSSGTSPARLSSGGGPVSPIASLPGLAEAGQGLLLDTLLARYAVDDLYVESAGIYDPATMGPPFAAT